jgi:uncharacterized protein (TIGR03067 family)
MAVAALATAVSRSGEPDKQELKRFQGPWQAVSMQKPDGTPVPQETVKETTLVIEGNKFSLRSGTGTISGKFEIDATKKPKAIDAILDQPDPSKKPVRFQGVYTWNEGRRTSCFAMPDKARPSSVVREAGYLVLEWEKAKR